MPSSGSGALVVGNRERDAGMQLAAVCERDDRRRDQAAAAGRRPYRDLEPFLDHPMDAVILVNDVDQHARAAIQALDRGLSVLSETAVCRTVGEGVALVEAAERSAGIYMFAENYPYIQLRNGALAHRMAGLFRSAGLAEVAVELMTLVVRDHRAVDGVLGLRSWTEWAHEAGLLTAADAARWPVLFDQAVATGRFLYAVTFFLTIGTKPG